MPLNNKYCKTEPYLNDLNPAELKYYPFVITLDKCDGSCNVLTKISGRIFVPNKTEDVNLSVFNLITRKNESKTLTKYTSCSTFNSNQK